MRRVEKPWGYELIWAEGKTYVGKILHVTAGHRLSRQYHQIKEETMMVLSGEVEIELGQGEGLSRRVLRPQESIHIPPGTVHRLIAITDVDVVEVSTPELDDVIRLEDSYGRTEEPLELTKKAVG
jgi:mannose-6-phosphate isomerase